MLEIFEQIKTILIELKIWDPIVIGFNIFIPTMAMVYLFGRMLNIAKKDRSKNLVAFITIVSSSWLQLFFNTNKLFSKIWNFYFIVCIGILLYVMIGFNLYPRFDAWLDKVFAKDENGKRRITRKKK